MSTVVFGPAAAAPVHGGHFEDVNYDSYMDLVFHFKTQETGISANDTETVLTGLTIDGDEFIGTDAIRVVPGNGKGKAGKPAAVFSWGQIKNLQ